MTTLHDFGSVMGRLLHTSFGLSQFHGHGSWLMCEVALSYIYRQNLSKLGAVMRELMFTTLIFHVQSLFH